MRIAITTTPAGLITGHAGRCRHFTIVEVEPGAAARTHVVELDEGQTFHATHVTPIALGRLDVLISQGMGDGLFKRLSAAGVKPFIVSETSCDAVVAALLAGTLVSGAPHAHGPGHHA